METFSVNITVDDCCCSKCRTNNMSTTKIITNISDFIPIQCNYFLQIIDVESTYVVLSIDNEFLHFVRKAFVGIPIKICIPNNCSSHVVTILVNSIVINSMAD